MIELRDYQDAMVQSIRAAYAKGHRAALLVAPTGSLPRAGTPARGLARGMAGGSWRGAWS